MTGIEDGPRRSGVRALPCGPPPSAFRRWTVTVVAGRVLVYVEADWRDALVVVEHGVIELRCVLGGHRRFAAGSILWFDGLNLQSLHNPGPTDVVLLGLSRDRE